MNDYVHSLEKLKLMCWTLPYQESCKFGAGDPIVCHTANFIPVLIHGACAIVRVSVVPAPRAAVQCSFGGAWLRVGVRLA